ncbi:MAG: hypothetical protein Q4E54_07955 [Lachnospiraceae bacterium]|nr:hypothetical protein [Lachnospiraceae bacterium]
MAEKMLITQALDERDLLVKKISDKIRKNIFVATKKHNSDTIFEHKQSVDDFQKEVESTFQSIQDLIARFNRIDAAIVKSNAETMIETSCGIITVAGAISLRNRMKGCGSYDGEADFEGNLLEKLNKDYQKAIQTAEVRNKELDNTAEGMRLSILGKETKAKDDKPLAVVDAYVTENTTELVDPLEIKKRIDYLDEKRNLLIRELDTQIKVSNATTFIEI